jgi:hypothetical protein
MRSLFTFLLAVFFTIMAIAQAPEKISYQSVIRDGSDKLVMNHLVGIKISILQGSVSGTSVYVETQSPISNANGLISIEIGGGTVVSGNISSIQWENGLYFIKTETDPNGGINYSITGTSQILSVPYSLYAKKAGNGFSGSYNDLTNKPSLFTGAWVNLTGKPTTVTGYGITDALTSSHPASIITSSNVTNWSAAYSWGNHATAGYQMLVVAGTAAQYWRGDKTWQTLNKSVIGLGNVENTALSTFVGSSALSSLGTITIGVWNAGAVTANGAVTGNSIIKTGGTSTQFLKADGSIDSNTYRKEFNDATDEFTATFLQGVFTLSHIPLATSKVKMFINGVRISNTAYDLSGTTLIYNPENNGSSPLIAGDRIQFDYTY